ncbi:outer membrane protein [Caballeronia udeis]|uniref:Outer membrane protein n=1 Tax=Caballeronia udeis TaxID=1232866 RepID=A0ABW8MI02_9BURK
MKFADFCRCTVVSFTCVWLTNAFADEQSATPDTGAAAADTTASDPWKVSIGPALMVSPKYPGSRAFQVLPLPSLDISYDDRIFSQGLDILGINLLKGPAYHFGTSISFDFQSRNESDDPRLHGLGNVHYGPKLKVFADYSVSLLTGSVAAYQDIAGTGQGLLVSGDLVANMPLTSKLLVSMGPGVTWANAVYNRTLFGVSASQSAASGLPAYNTSSGVRDVHLNTYVSYDFSKKWVGSVSLTAGRLEHNAGHSPITEQRTELNFLAAVNYRFK